MFPAFLTTFFFAATAPIARQTARRLGPATANFARLALAVLVLGLWVATCGTGFGAAWPWFLASGLAGFGLGGFLMFQALPRAGSNLANLIVQCGSAVVALLLEWLWLGTRLDPAQLACVVLVLAGVAVGLAPRSFPQLSPEQVRRGTVLAVLSAVGQGLGAVLTRRAFAAAREAGAIVDPGTATFERLLGGLVVALLGWTVFRLWLRRAETPVAPGRAWPWVVANTLTGPVLGVTCMQWALKTTPAGIVQPIIAMAPLLTAPLALGLGEALPQRRYFAGTLMAVLALVVLWRLRSP